MNPTALVTGASRGIGRAIALSLARLGHDLVINYANQRPAADQTAEDCQAAAIAQGHSIRTHVVQADISHPAQRQYLLSEAQSFLGHCHLLVNNAGIAPTVRADLLDAGEESLEQLLHTNLHGPFFISQQVARWMIANPPPHLPHLPHDPRPKILFISSISTYTASVNRGDYCIAKAGVAMLTRLFAARLASENIGVFEIRPGIIATDMTGPVRDKYDRLIADGLTPIRRWGTTDDVAAAIAAIAEGRFPFSTGMVLDIDGGFHLRTL